MGLRERSEGAITGLLAAGVAVGIGELGAALTRPQASPVAAVGAAALDLSPTSVKNFAIRTFGSSDKPVLIAGIIAVLAVCGLATGAFASRRPAVALIGVGVLGAAGLAAVLSRPEVRPTDGIPALLATLAGVTTFHLLLWRAPVIASTVNDDASPPAAPAGAVIAEEAEDTVEVATPVGDAVRDTGADGLNAGSGGLGATDIEWDGVVPEDDGLDDPAVHGDRRRFLRSSAAAAGVAAVAGVGGRFLQHARFSAAQSRASVRIPPPGSSTPPVPAVNQISTPGISPFYTPNNRFYRVDTAIVVPQVQAETWKLRIHGQVDRPLTLTYDQLVARELLERDVTLTCVSNEVGDPYIGNARWIGAHLGELLEEAGVHDGADQLACRSADGMTIGAPTKAALDGRDAMLAVAMNAEPLPVEHGFPVRMVIPGLYGYVSACKWIVDIEVTTFGRFDAYWVERGWAQQGPIRTQSRIDTPGSGASLKAGKIAVAGVAWAQHRGIDRVELQVDDDDWFECRLSGVSSVDTWRQWVYAWDATPGEHRLRVRATDSTRTVQSQRRHAAYPDGATGWHTITVAVSS